MARKYKRAEKCGGKGCDLQPLEEYYTRSIREIDLDEREETKDLPEIKGKEKAKTSEELYREYAQSGMTLNDFALSVGISRTTLWRKFKNINSENKNETRNN